MTRAQSTKCGIRTLDDLKGRCIVNDETGCWDWQGATTEGQPRVWLRNPDTGVHQTMTGTRAAFALAKGFAVPDGMTAYRRPVCCARCVNPDHVRVGTKAKACAVLAASGKLKGNPLRAAMNTAIVRRTRARLSPQIVEEIRASSETNTALAARYGVGHQAISAVRLGKNWRGGDVMAGSSVFSLGSGARAHLRGGE